MTNTTLLDELRFAARAEERGYLSALWDQAADTIERLQRELAEARPCDHHKSMFESAISALAAIDRELGMPEDGCNEPDATLEAIRALKRQLADEHSIALGRLNLNLGDLHD